MHCQRGLTVFRRGVIKGAVSILALAVPATAQNRMTAREMGVRVGVLRSGQRRPRRDGQCQAERCEAERQSGRTVGRRTDRIWLLHGVPLLIPLVIFGP